MSSKIQLIPKEKKTNHRKENNKLNLYPYGKENFVFRYGWRCCRF